MREAKNGFQPAVAERLGKLLDATALLGSGQGGEELGQTGLLAAQNIGDSRSVLARLERLVPGEDFVAGEEEFDRLSGLQLAALVRGVLDLHGERLKLLDLMGEIVERFCDLVKSGHLILEVARSAKLFDQSLGRARMASSSRTTGSLFLAGKLEMAIGLEFLFREVPPLLEGRGIEDLRSERRGDLIQALPFRRDREGFREASEAGSSMRLRLDGGRVGDFPGENVFRWNWLESFSGILGLHEMALLRLKIDDDLTGEQTPLGHAPEPPALVQATGARLKEGEGLGGLGRKFSSIDGLLEFFVHGIVFG